MDVIIKNLLHKLWYVLCNFILILKELFKRSICGCCSAVLGLLFLGCDLAGLEGPEQSLHAKGIRISE